jgi:hypothetical protein
MQLGVQAALCARDSGEQPLFEQAGRRTMRLEVGPINHPSIRLTFQTRQPGEDAVEDAYPAPADKAVIEGLVRTVIGRRITPAQAIADDMEDAADHALIVAPGTPWERGK